MKTGQRLICKKELPIYDNKIAFAFGDHHIINDVLDDGRYSVIDMFGYIHTFDDESLLSYFELDGDPLTPHELNKLAADNEAKNQRIRELEKKLCKMTNMWGELGDANQQLKKEVKTICDTYHEWTNAESAILEIKQLLNQKP